MYFIGLDVHKKLSGWNTSRRGRKERGFGDDGCAGEGGSHGPRSSVVFLNPSRSLGLSVAYESLMTTAEDRSDLD